MKLTIDNLQGAGPADYTAVLDGTIAPQVERIINRPSQMKCSLVANTGGFVVPVAGARVSLAKANGSFVFTGYLTQAPQLEHLGWGERGTVYRYSLIAESDEVLLDQKALPNRAPFLNRSAGSALRQLAEDLLPGEFDTSAIEEVDTLATYTVNPQKKFSDHAAQIALAARASYRTTNGELVLSPVGAASYAIEESDASFSPAGLKMSCPNLLVNDVTVIGLDEPEAYVRDYFVGDGLSLRFYLSQTPFQQSRGALIEEEYDGPALDAATWAVNDPTAAISLAAQTLEVNGGAGEGQTTVAFVEQIEMGGALEFQHGDVSIAGPSQGVLGGLYAGAISAAGCLAGFQVTPSEAGSNIQALITGAPTGPVVATTPGHRYVLTTYLYSMEVYRSQQRYHSSSHPAGTGWGGAAVPANTRVVLELHDIDPSNPATMVGAATVLYDDVIENAPGFCTYALVDAIHLQCSIAYTYVGHIALPEVRVALPNSNYVTQLIGSIADGAQCQIVSSTTLDFLAQAVPPLNTMIAVSYRGTGRAVAEVQSGASVTKLQSGPDDGTRGLKRTVTAPSARTQADCENAALAILDDRTEMAWSGSYATWSDFLPGGATDIFPGDAVAVNVPSREAAFTAIVRKVTISVEDPAGDRGMYAIEFANDAAAALALEDEANAVTISLLDQPAAITTDQVGACYLENLTNAQVVTVSATTVNIDAGLQPSSGCGIEVRLHDYGWGEANDRNLLGRFATETFSLPRLASAQTYFLRLYDNSSPPRYSRYAAALHVSCPL
ncbi:MAG TPA: hypothetical protein VMB19_08310 [Silvibacterium sp.]|nr:hypothetical protein [Silvibacterium sp.]